MKFSKMYFITPHAVERYKDMTRLTAATAIEDILMAMQKAVIINVSERGMVHYGYSQAMDTHYGFVVIKSTEAEKWDAIKTILGTGAYECRKYRHSLRALSGQIPKENRDYRHSLRGIR